MIQAGITGASEGEINIKEGLIPQIDNIASKVHF